MDSSIYVLELQNGEKVNLTLNFASLYKLRAKDKKLYDIYNKAAANKEPDEIDNARIIYTAYVCASSNDEIMSFENFLEVIPYDREIIGDAIASLLVPQKKTQNLQNRSFRRQRR